MEINIKITEKDFARWRAEDEAQNELNELEEVVQDILDNDPEISAEVARLRKEFNKRINKKHHGNKQHKHRRPRRC